MYELILKERYDYQNRIFALCESCYWTATIFMKIEGYQCPICLSKDVALMPLNLDEKYEFDFERKRGLQIRFSTVKREVGK
jgi:hypothetical protein